LFHFFHSTLQVGLASFGGAERRAAQPCVEVLLDKSSDAENFADAVQAR
jgi:hypothetical protein